MRIFISYATEQAKAAERIYRKLLAAGYEVFFGADSIHAADDYDERIREEIDKADGLLFLASRESLKEGKFTLTELRMFSEKWPDPSGRVLTVMLDDVPPGDLPPYLEAVTSAFKPLGNVPSEVVAAAVKHWPLEKRRWLMWAGALVLTITAVITAFQLIPNPAPQEERTNSEPTDSSHVSDASSETIVPIEFNVQENAIPLVFQSYTLSRTDEFKIDPDKTVEFLKDSLKSHYKLTIPPDLAMRASGGGYFIEEQLTADYQRLYGSPKIAETDIKANDVIRFAYVLTNPRPMACFLPDVFIVVNGIVNDDPVLLLNGNKATDVTKNAGSHDFYFKFVGECNPSSWIAQLYLGDDVYFLTNPQEISPYPDLIMKFVLPAAREESTP